MSRAVDNHRRKQEVFSKPDFTLDVVNALMVSNSFLFEKVSDDVKGFIKGIVLMEITTCLTGKGQIERSIRRGENPFNVLVSVIDYQWKRFLKFFEPLI